MEVALTFPVADVAVITAVPAVFVVTKPLLSTDAISGFDEVHSIFLFVAFVGTILALSCIEVPE